MKWGAEQDAELQDYFRKLIALRGEHPVLTTGERRCMHLDAEAGTYAYLRAADPSRHTPGDVIAAFNLSREPRTITVPLPGLTAARDLLNDNPVQRRSDGLAITLAPQSGDL